MRSAWRPVVTHGNGFRIVEPFSRRFHLRPVATSCARLAPQTLHTPVRRGVQARCAMHPTRVAERETSCGSAKPFARSASTTRRTWRLVEEKEPPVVLECPAYASQLFGRGGRPEDVDVDGKDLVKPRLAWVEVRHVDGLEHEPPCCDVLRVPTA